MHDNNSLFQTAIAFKLMDVIIYDNDFINRVTPFNGSKHYSEWIGKISEKVVFPNDDMHWWFNSDRIETFAIGDNDDKEEMINDYPELKELDKTLEEYYEYLCNEFKN